jgi:hypothetical protein
MKYNWRRSQLKYCRSEQMIMQEQELTLFGGWARAQIPQPIEIGVGKTSVTHSVSTFVRSDNCEEAEKSGHISTISGVSTFVSSDDCEEWLCDKVRQSRPCQTISTEKVSFTIEIEKAVYDFAYHQEKMITVEPTADKKIRTGFDGSQYEVRSQWDELVYMTWGYLAFSRFFEIWEKGTLDDMMRGLAGNLALKRSFSGLIGAHNGMGKGREKKELGRNAKGEWFLKDNAVIDSRVRKLPEGGAANAQRCARELRRQRLAKRSHQS